MSAEVRFCLPNLLVCELTRITAFTECTQDAERRFCQLLVSRIDLPEPLQHLVWQVWIANSLYRGDRQAREQ